MDPHVTTTELEIERARRRAAAGDRLTIEQVAGTTPLERRLAEVAELVDDGFVTPSDAALERLELGARADVGGLTPVEWAATARGDAVPARRPAPAPALDLDDEVAVYAAQVEADASLIRSHERRRRAEQRGHDLGNVAVAFGLGILLAVILIVASGPPV